MSELAVAEADPTRLVLKAGTELEWELICDGPRSLNGKFVGTRWNGDFCGGPAGTLQEVFMRFATELVPLTSEVQVPCGLRLTVRLKPRRGRAGEG